VIVDNKRVIVFVGAYGSGKTEIAINYALRRRRLGEKVTLIDLDLVTPYFRSREARQPLEQEGVDVVSPEGGLAMADLPVMPPRIAGSLDDRERCVIIDVGGDPTGARVLGTIRKSLPEGDHDILIVLNARRPFTRTPDTMLESMGRIEAASRVKITGIVNNTHVCGLTTPAEVLDGYEKVAAVGRESGLPVVFSGALKEVVAQIDADSFPTPLLSISRHMLAPWEQPDEYWKRTTPMRLEEWE
jgi:hypothetical protein